MAGLSKRSVNHRVLLSWVLAKAHEPPGYQAPPHTPPLRNKALRNQSTRTGRAILCERLPVLPLPTGGGQSSHQMSLIIFLGVGAYWTVLLIRSLSHPQPGQVAIVLFLTYHRKIRLSVTTETPCESQGRLENGVAFIFLFILLI